MTANKAPNVLVMQSGGCTPVLNRSLNGVVAASTCSTHFGAVYGSIHGLEGILEEKFIDLTCLSKSTWSNISRSPGAALGSTRRKFRSEDSDRVVNVFADWGIKYLFTIGGNDSAGTALQLSYSAKSTGYPLTVMNIPKTIDNDLVLTDHSPGYGSTARFIALAAMGAGQDALSMGKAAPITIIEVMGRDAGWLAAASALASRKDSDAPHLICIPEIPVEELRFLDAVDNAYCKYGFVVAVVSENSRGPDGSVLGGETEPWLVDDFGHAYYDGPARYLAGLIQKRLGVRVRYEKPGTIQRSFVEALSNVDCMEAEMVGRDAVSYALSGHDEEMVTLVRDEYEKYSCHSDTVDLSKVADQVKIMPNEYFQSKEFWVTDAFLKYAGPLIGEPLPMVLSLI